MLKYNIIHTLINANEHTYLGKGVEFVKLYEGPVHCSSPHLSRLCHMKAQGIELGQGVERD
jgi:hypothetical protein